MKIQIRTVFNVFVTRVTRDKNFFDYDIATIIHVTSILFNCNICPFEPITLRHSSPVIVLRATTTKGSIQILELNWTSYVARL